jgi:hypothetical protein
MTSPEHKTHLQPRPEVYTYLAFVDSGFAPFRLTRRRLYAVIHPVDGILACVQDAKPRTPMINRFMWRSEGDRSPLEEAFGPAFRGFVPLYNFETTGDCYDKLLGEYGPGGPARRL